MAGVTNRGDERSDRLLAPTWWTAVCIVPVLVAAWTILYLFPDRTTALWAWTITPEMSAIVMGGGYVSGAYFFVRGAMRARDDFVGPDWAVTAFTVALVATSCA